MGIGNPSAISAPPRRLGAGVAGARPRPRAEAGPREPSGASRFTKASARKLFREFSRVEIRVAYPFTYGFRYFVFWVPRPLRRLLGRWIGWHLMIRATR